ncbi:MAG: T9SS type A sorting domain-containing protein [Bacteroidales bacterium]|nr:T9SS type A sorting domain-containing protein [Bacteroidales bacterium]
MTRPDKGTGSWDQKLFTYTNGPTTLSWPRMITTGDDHNTIHLLANTNAAYQGQAFGIVYSRSLDGGTSWDLQNEVVDGTGAEYYTEITADQYVWANPVGDNIAFLVASAWHDLFMMKSTDNGDSWEKTVIWEHPYPFFDWNITVTDTLFCVDNSASIALDNNGKAHVVFGISRVIHAVVGTGYSYYPYVDGIGYWNEDMPTFSDDLSALAPPQYGYPTSEMIEDVNYIGWTQDVDGDGEITFINTSTGFPMSYRELGVSTMPSITIGPDNWIAVVFSSTTETYDNSEWNFKKLWMRIKPSGMNWGPFIHLTQDLSHFFDESIYPVAYPTFDNDIHILYNNDGMPGTALGENHVYIENMTTYMKVEQFVGVEENQPLSAESESLIISPNPSKGMVNASYSINRASHVTMMVSEISGRAVINKTLGWKNAGDYMYSFDLENFCPGIYFISLKTSHQTITKKLIIN